MNPVRVLGIDPGLQGAIAAYWPNENALVVNDMPVFKKGTKYVLDIATLCRAINEWTVELAIVENVHSMPKQGVASSFKFGQVFGTIQGVLSACQIPTRYVEPRAWKQYFGLIGKGKDASRLRAGELLPAHADNWPLKKHDGRAEAALLALYGAKVWL